MLEKPSDERQSIYLLCRWRKCPPNGQPSATYCNKASVSPQLTVKQQGFTATLGVLLRGIGG
ncbi:hypothetical protein [Serratia symbiotica]|uniref:hypothetical protein n=1 Tax=Serratia symbiotica TaxID=138074 RepID=UPI0011B7EB1C|nr:hypothetical protein [Serratia symbiotica]